MVAAGTSPILEVKDLRTYFHTRTGVVKAVDGVNFELYPGETLGSSRRIRLREEHDVIVDHGAGSPAGRPD